MAILLSCQAITKAYFAKTLFTDLTLGVNDGDKLGIIGPNGAGKSTLLKLLAGLETADAGDIARRRHLKVSYVEQMPNFDPSGVVKQVLGDAAVAAGCPA